MDDFHSSHLLGLLIFLILCSAFFSSSETGMLSINRYRLKHLAKEGHKGARRVSRLLERPDQLTALFRVEPCFVGHDTSTSLHSQRPDFALLRHPWT